MNSIINNERELKVMEANKKYSYIGKTVSVDCSECKIQFDVAYNTFYHKPKNYLYRCPTCMKKHRSNLMSIRNKDPSFRSSVISGQQSFWDNLSKVDKDERINKMVSGSISWYNNLSDIEKQKLKDNQRVVMTTLWDNMTKNDKDAVQNKSKEWWENLSHDEKQKWTDRTKFQWNSMTDDERKLHTKKLRMHYNNLSDSEKSNIHSHQSMKMKERWKSLSDVEKKEYSIRSKKNYKNYYSTWYQSLTHERKEEFHRNTFNKSNGKNQLHMKFENQFNQSNLVVEYYYVSEILLENNNINHMWDYGIYLRKTNELVMVIDLDGTYFHADNGDYSGLQSREEYDECRFKSVSSDIKYYIIHESQFIKAFEGMIKQLILNYDEFIQQQFNICRSIPFPYPSYTDDELIKSYNHLSKLKCEGKHHSDININNRYGDRIINHFHHSIYSAKRAGKISPYDAWYNDELLKKVIKNRVIYVNTLNPNKILQGFNISKVAPKVSVFSAGRAKLLIHKYLNEYDTIFDPFSGFSGRMLGVASLGKQYIGQDISPIHIKESNQIIEFLSLQNNAIITQQDILQSKGKYDCLFTCPPYSDKEQWYDIPTTIKSCDDWIDECLSKFECNKYLFVVDNTDKYKGYIVNEIMNKSHLNKNKEYVILIQKIDIKK